MCTECACGAADNAPADVQIDGASRYQVSGMTCGHCVSSVSTEIGTVGGVTSVAVDLPTGAVTVSGAGFSEEEIRLAVDRAGYTLAGPLSSTG